MQRRALFLSDDCGRAKAVPVKLSGFDWRLDIVHDMHDASEKAAQHHYNVGLAMLTPGALEHGISELMQEIDRLKWIAIVEECQLDDSEIVSLIHNHCYDFHTWPTDTYRLAVTLGRADGMARIAPPGNSQPRNAVNGMIGDSEVMQTFHRRLQRAANAGLDVLVVGESGSGKELAAKAIHLQSEGRDGPLVVVNCSSLHDQLLYSELFGHEKGAFSGATGRRIGKFEQAHGGTLVLDEIGNMPYELQAHLLRFLDDRLITRLGSYRSVSVDTRVICTSNEDLEQLVAEGKLREDLYHRIDGVRLSLPPLRERDGDVEPLARHFLAQYCEETGRKFDRGLTKGALRLLHAYRWPGNVRELQNIVRRSAFAAKGRSIRARDVQIGQVELESLPLLGEARSAAERKTLRKALRLSQGNLSQAARSIGVSRVSFYRLMRKHNLAESV